MESPSKLYNNFYQTKRELIEKFTPGGHIPFESWTSELINCKVDNMQTEIFDNKTYVRQMGQIQQHMDRVKNIQIKCNNQYFIWERFIPNIAGALARVEYLKPSIKQDGLAHQHMRDIEWYFGNLKHIHESAKGVMKTLEKAFETVSRKATITSPVRSSDKYYPRNNIIQQNDDQEMEDYDDLPSNPTVVLEKKENSFCEWGDIK